MRRREFTKTLLGFPLGISCGLLAAIPGPLARSAQKPALLVTVPGMISAELAMNFEKQLDFRTPGDWRDISEIWFRHLADDVRKQAVMVFGLTLHSHFFALQEFSRGRQFNWSTGKQLRDVSIARQWTEKQLAEALKTAWQDNFTTENLPAGEHCLTSWCLIADKQS